MYEKVRMPPFKTVQSVMSRISNLYNKGILCKKKYFFGNINCIKNVDIMRNQHNGHQTFI